MVRAGVFIGVDKTGQLQKLNDAASGAKSMYEWALSQGMPEGTHAKLITDAGGQKVHPDLIYDAIKAIIDGPGVDQLILYFAGHGVNLNRNELWLLTDAPVKTSAAVNVSGSVDLAQYCGIPHVVIVSDACRVAPAGIQAQNVRGVDVFPNDAVAPRPLPVDQFFACARGNTAAEIQDPALAAGTFQALYTHALLDALSGKRPEVLERSQDPGDTWSYVRPVKLKEYLERELPLRVQQRRLEKKVNQNPEAILIAHESWISRVDASSMPMAAGPTMRSGRRRTLTPSASQEFNTAIGTLVRSATHDAFRVVAEELSKAGDDPNRDVARLAARARTMAMPFGPDFMATECGIKVRGAHIVDFFTPARAELVGTSGDVLQVSGIEGHAASVVLRFKGNVGAVVPAISGFLTALTFEDGELADVAFEPSANTSRGNFYKDHADEMRTLRAIAASAGQHGRFRLEKADSASVARRMRYAKNINPALALYAAYAWHDLQDVERIRQMSGHLRDEVGVTLFDLALLGRTLLGQSVDRSSGVVPFVPLLSQGWSLLRAHRVRLHPALDGVDLTVRQSMWSLFDAPGIEMLTRALSSGDVR